MPEFTKTEKSDGAMGKGMDYSEKECYKQSPKQAKRGKQKERKGNIKGYSAIQNF